MIIWWTDYTFVLKLSSKSTVTNSLEKCDHCTWICDISEDHKFTSCQYLRMHKSYLTGRCCPCGWEWPPSPRRQLATGSEISNLPRSGSWASEAQACYLGGGQPWGCWAAGRLCVWLGQVGHSHVQCRIFCRKHVFCAGGTMHNVYIVQSYSPVVKNPL